MLSLATGVSAAVQDEIHMLDIPAQDAASALVELCLAANCELAFVGPARGEVRTRALRGRMSWRTAVQRLTAGTELRHRFVGERGVRIWLVPRPAPPPLAPSAEPTEVAPVFVHGRLSDQIDETLRRKRAADAITDGVSSERMGDLPAANLAEALQRVPGVTIEREVGEGQFVSVRGLGPLFQSVTLNGAPVAFSENIRNSTQSGRQFRFRALSADLLAGARLTKTATPDLIDGGIGSNIDIETIGGLDGAPFLTARAGAGLEARTGRRAPDVSAAGRHVAADGAWGLVAGVSEEQRSVLYDRFQIQRYTDLAIEGRMAAAPTDVRTTIEREDRRRRSAFLGADWRATPSLSLDFDALISTFDNTIREDRLVFSLGERLQDSGVALAVRNGVVTSADVPEGRIDNNTEVSDQAHLNMTAALGAEILWGGWRINPRLSGSAAESRLDTPLLRLSSRAATTPAYSLDIGGADEARRARLLHTDLDLLDPGLLVEPRLTVRAVASRDEDWTGLIDARSTIDLAWGGVRLSALQIGGQFSDRSRDYQRRDRQAALRPGATVTPGFYTGGVPGDVFANLLRVRPGPWATADFERFSQVFVIPGERDDVMAHPRDLIPTGADLQNSYRVGERAVAAYVRFDLEGTLAERPLTGNFGVRLVHTRTEVDGAVLGVDGDGAAQIQRTAYAGGGRVWLPSANLALAFDDRRLLRLAASRTVTRPSLADLSSATVPASTLVSAVFNRGQAEIDSPSPGTIFSGVGGNPALQPYLSTNLDLSWEWTFPRGGLSVALFHKSIDDFILNVEALEPLVFETRAGPPVMADVLMARPRNVGHATIQGLELGFHRRLSSGLGLWASATWTDAAATDRRSQERHDLAGVSRFAYTLNPFFERGPFAASLAWSWRSAFRSEADMQGGGVSAFVVAPAGYLDAQVSWDLSPAAQLVIAASNLTDTTEMAYESQPERLLQLGHAGPNYLVSLRWTL
ncbi:TonB-dependent receptor [Brevundimonas diminuta]|uniref:TonB-dependent receptor n=1 Tax=Brevundimonas diminuta TaxID=293 RepID=UPI003D0029D5